MLRLLSFASSTREEEDKQFVKITFTNIAHIRTTSNYIKFLIGVNFHGDLHLDVRNKSKLKVKIGISLRMVE